jgi:hypothetical protein
VITRKIAWVKLRALRDNAPIASKKLWSQIQKCLCGMSEIKSKKV